MERSIRTAAAAGSGWHFISPNEAGFTSDLEALFDEAIAQQRVWNLHGVVIVRKGSLVLERYFDCDNDARGRPLGTVAFNVDTLHDLRSVAPLLASFPEYTDLAADPARNRGPHTMH